jgi:hypothetical protein
LRFSCGSSTFFPLMSLMTIWQQVRYFFSHLMLTFCSLNVHWLLIFTDCSLNIQFHWMCIECGTECALHVHCMCTACSLNVRHWLLPEYSVSLNVHWMWHWMCTACALHVHCMFTECSAMNAPWMFTQCSLTAPWKKKKKWLTLSAYFLSRGWLRIFTKPTPPRAISVSVICDRIALIAHTFKREGLLWQHVQSNRTVESAVISSIRPERQIESQSQWPGWDLNLSSLGEQESI